MNIVQTIQPTNPNISNNPNNSSAHYTMITDYIAVGDYLSSYEPFDVIVNLCFPENGLEHRQIAVSHITTDAGKNKTIIRVGINDESSEDMPSLLDKIIPYLLELHNQNSSIKILFHCYAGISRSSTVAIAYIMTVYGLTLNAAFNIVKSRRNFIKPNPGFVFALQEFEKMLTR